MGHTQVWLVIGSLVTGWVGRLLCNMNSATVLAWNLQEWHYVTGIVLQAVTVLSVTILILLNGEKLIKRTTVWFNRWFR